MKYEAVQLGHYSTFLSIVDGTDIDASIIYDTLVS